jgi:hypothetical protein
VGSILRIAGAVLGVYGVVIAAYWIPGSLPFAAQALFSPGMSLAGLVGLFFAGAILGFAAVEAVLGYRAFISQDAPAALLVGGLFAITYAAFFVWQPSVQAREGPMIPISLAVGVVSFVSGLIGHMR